MADKSPNPFRLFLFKLALIIHLFSKWIARKAAGRK